jgi:ribosomal protein S18 acetylase RimI-like enzyme
MGIVEIKQIAEGKRAFLPLLLLADEQESMIEKYLERGDLFALYDDGLKCVCVVSDEGGGAFELQNIAVDPAFQRRGYGSRMVRHVLAHYSGKGRSMRAGTGDSPSVLPFYESCGFAYSHRVKDYIFEHYGPIYEDGVMLRDKVYLTKELE